jgi:hypothetical protein
MLKNRSKGSGFTLLGVLIISAMYKDHPKMFERKKKKKKSLETVNIMTLLSIRS